MTRNYCLFSEVDPDDFSEVDPDDTRMFTEDPDVLFFSFIFPFFSFNGEDPHSRRLL